MIGEDPAQEVSLDCRAPQRGQSASSQSALIGMALGAWMAVPVWAERAKTVPGSGDVGLGSTWTFGYTGGPQLFTVPQGVTNLVITAVGGSGEAIDHGRAPGPG